MLVIFYGHGKRNGSRARAPYIRPYIAFHDILTWGNFPWKSRDEGKEKEIEINNGKGWETPLKNSVKQNRNKNEKDERTVSLQQSIKATRSKTDGTEEQRQRKTERRRQRTVNMSGTVFLIFIYLWLEIILYHRIIYVYVFVFYSTDHQGERSRNRERTEKKFTPRTAWSYKVFKKVKSISVL